MNQHTAYQWATRAGPHIPGAAVGVLSRFCSPSFCSLPFLACMYRSRRDRKGPSMLVLSPTRELALQIESEVKKYDYHNIRWWVVWLHVGVVLWEESMYAFGPVTLLCCLSFCWSARAEPATHVFLLVCLSVSLPLCISLLLLQTCSLA